MPVGRASEIAVAIGALLLAMAVAGSAVAQKPGGVLRMPIGNSPAEFRASREQGVLADHSPICNPSISGFDKLLTIARPISYADRVFSHLS